MVMNIVMSIKIAIITPITGINAPRITNKAIIKSNINNINNIVKIILNPPFLNLHLEGCINCEKI